MIRHAWAAALLIPMLAGCAGIPFAAPELSPLPAEMAYDDVVRDFRAALPARFASDDSIIIRRGWREFAMLGYSRVDREAGTFELLCLNHMGIKLFHLAGDRRTVRVISAVTAFADPPELLAAIAEDVRNMYLDLVPATTVALTVGHDTLRYRVAADDGSELEYVFGGEGMRLLEKRRRRGWRLVWQAGFYEYGTGPGGLSPRGIVVENRQHGYRLIVKNRTWQPLREDCVAAPHE